MKWSLLNMGMWMDGYDEGGDMGSSFGNLASLFASVLILFLGDRIAFISTVVAVFKSSSCSEYERTIRQTRHCLRRKTKGTVH